MAINGSFNTESFEGRSVAFVWNAVQSIEKNTSVINWQIVGSGSYTGYVVVSELEVKINGSQQFYRNNTNHTNVYIGTVIASGSIEISHNADGSGSFSAEVKAGIYEWSINCVGSASITLNTIPRASTISWGSGSSQTAGGNTTINITSAASGFRHTLWYRFGDVIEEIVNKTDSLSVSWTIPMDLINQLPNATKGTGLVYCDTYSGETLCGTKTLELVVNVPSSIVPTINGLTRTDTKGHLTTFGKYVQNKSVMKMTVNASGVRGSTITKYNVVVNGKSTYNVNPCEHSIAESGDSLPIEVTVTDSRGRTATKSYTFSVYEYFEPTASKLTGVRCDQDGTLNDEGAYILITYSGDIASIGNKNDKNITVRYRSQDTSTWTTAITESIYSADNHTVIVPADTEKQFNLSLVVTDVFGSAERTWNISTAFTLIDFNESGYGVAFGKVSQGDEMDIALNMLIRKPLQALKNETSGDFNNYLTVGKYIVKTDARMSSFQNSPSSYAGSLYVLSLLNASINSIDGAYRYLLQVFVDRFGNVYTRTVTSGSSGTSITYGTWKHLIDDSQMQTDIGTMYENSTTSNFSVSASSWKNGTTTITVPKGTYVITAHFNTTIRGNITGALTYNPDYIRTTIHQTSSNTISGDLSDTVTFTSDNNVIGLRFYSTVSGNITRQYIKAMKIS